MLAGCCLLQGGSMGVIQNCRGLFYAPVIDDLGFGMGAFNSQLFCFGLCACLVFSVIDRIFERFPFRVIISLCSALYAGAFLFCGFFRSLPAFYVSCAIQGLSGGVVMYYCAQVVLGNWFRKKLGLALGLSSAFAGVAGILFNPIGNAVIEAWGWRVGYWFLGGVSLAMTLSVSLFLLRLHPAELGLEPYGAEDMPVQTDTLSGVPAPTVKRTPHYWMIVFSAFLAAFQGAFATLLNSFSAYIGYGAAVGALMASVSMAGNVFSKLFLGRLYDRFRLRTTLYVGVIGSFVAFALLLVDNVPIRFVGSFFLGFPMAMNNVVPPIIIKDVYGERDYGRLIPNCTMAVMLALAFSSAFVGFLVDVFGNRTGYTISILFYLATVLLMGILLRYAVRGGRTLRAEYAAEQKG